ncbi:unnamed protein product [Brugia timori]|uniref:Uncharacterized protein n=1 Tax=Brugia timori TaxID=42155 RepID=A0A3P7U478_9BILA|nr:unnamed protein product [Brugia timori]
MNKDQIVYLPIWQTDLVNQLSASCEKQILTGRYSDLSEPKYLVGYLLEEFVTLNQSVVFNNCLIKFH